MQNRASWMDVLKGVKAAFESNREKLVEQATHLTQHLLQSNIKAQQNQEIETIATNDEFKMIAERLLQNADTQWGGFGVAPKFPQTFSIQVLLRNYFQNKDQASIVHAIRSIDKMIQGGIYDHVGGGFSRYTVDAMWQAPHFEKMLYDNGQLISLYSDTYKLTQNPLYKEIIEKSLDFVKKEWKTTEGGFFSALDADSLNDQNHLEEGAFYVWKIPQLKTILKDDFDLFRQVFNINSFGLWEEENYVLIQNQSLEMIAELNHLSLTELATKKKNWEQLLYTEREKRAKPRLDDKCLTSWNAIMLKGFVDAYKALGDQEYLNSAIANANFIIKKLWSQEGNLFHSYKNDTSSINGYLEDYCFVIAAFIALYEVTLEEKWLQDAKQLTDYTLEHFYDVEEAFFRFTSDKDDALISVHYETEDNVIPASNSVMAKNLNQLGIYFNNSYYEKISQQMLAILLPNIDYPSAYSNWLDLSLTLSEQNRELAICGPDATEMNTIITGLYLPNVIVAGTKKSSPLPFLKDRFTSEKNLFYVCQNKTCQLPVEDFQEMITQLSWKS